MQGRTDIPRSISEVMTNLSTPLYELRLSILELTTTVKDSIRRALLEDLIQHSLNSIIPEVPEAKLNSKPPLLSGKGIEFEIWAQETGCWKTISGVLDHLVQHFLPPHALRRGYAEARTWNLHRLFRSCKFKIIKKRFSVKVWEKRPRKNRHNLVGA